MQCKSRVWMLAMPAMLAMGMSAQAQPPAVCKPQDPPSVISGGVGETELQALRELEPGHNLKLVFTLEGGQFVTDVDVQIRSAASGDILRHRARGPWLLACLPAGSYTVFAEHEALRQSRTLLLGKGLRTEYLRWAAGADDMVLKPEPRSR